MESPGLPLALVAALIPSATLAAPTMAIWAGASGSLATDLTTSTGNPFDVVVTLNSDGHDSAAAEWVMTDLRTAFPGVIALATTKINNTALDLGINNVGEYLMAFGACEPAGDRVELLRITYADFGGVIGSTSIVLGLRGFEPGDSQPSTFSGLPGFVDCAGSKYAAPMGGNSADGALCVNCYSPPVTESSITELKTKF